MSQQFEFNGFHYSVDVHKVKNGWTWSYIIEGGKMYECTDRPLPDDTIALHGARRDAEGRIARMKH